MPPPAHWMSRRGAGARVLCVLVTLLGLACVSPAPLPEEDAPGQDEEPSSLATAVPPGSTVVTLTFADTEASQIRAAALLARYGMHGTFYMSSGRIGFPDKLSIQEVRAIADAGNEIGGHTLEHEDLESLPPAEVRHQVCDDRVALMQLGFPVTSFAYPFSSDTPSTRQIVIECNFNNARATGLIRNPYGCNSCARSETLPPVDAFRIRATTSVKPNWTAADLQSLVTQVENTGGGWMMIAFHNVCNGTGTCAGNAVHEPVLDAFLAWLAPRVSRGTFVLTTHEVIGGPLKPAVASDGGIVDAGFPSSDAGTDAGVPDAGRPDAGTDAGVPDAGTDAGVPDAGVVIALPNPSLETDADGDNVPDCWKRTNTGTNTGSWLRTTEAHSGSWAQRPRITSYTSGDRRLVVLQDSGNCAPRGTPGRRYRVTAWYRADASAGFVATYRTTSGWVTWTSGPALPLSASTYVRGQWVTPPLPAGATHLSVGLALRGVGTLFMDDFTLEQLP